MRKGVTVIRSLQRPLAPDKVGPEHAEPTFLQALSIKAGTAKAHRFQNLYGSLNESLLHEAWRNLNKRGAPGVDKVTIAQYGENLDDKPFLGFINKWMEREHPLNAMRMMRCATARAKLRRSS